LYFIIIINIILTVSNNNNNSNNNKRKANTNTTANKKNSSPFSTKSPMNVSKGSTNKSTPTNTPSACTTPVTSFSNQTNPSIFSTNVPVSSNITSNASTTPTTNNSTGQRVVQYNTIQLTPQNQQLLRNIQAQISRLVALATRNENEETALQKLIYLQQQVIATGTPVLHPNQVRKRFYSFI